MKPSFDIVGAAIIAAGLCVFARAAAPAAEPSTGLNLADMKLIPLEGLPACATGAVVNGDPGKGGSIIFAQVKSGCDIPWHWHTPAENLMIVSGDAQVQMKDAVPAVLHAGGYIVMPPHHVHHFRCVSRKADCVFYVYADGPFDIHYVDAQGNEIPATQALQSRPD